MCCSMNRRYRKEEGLQFHVLFKAQNIQERRTANIDVCNRVGLTASAGCCYC